MPSIEEINRTDLKEEKLDEKGRIIVAENVKLRINANIESFSLEEVQG